MHRWFRLLILICLSCIALRASASSGPAQVGQQQQYLPLIDSPCEGFCGQVTINDGLCCIGGVAGVLLSMPVSFFARSRNVPVIEQRVDFLPCQSDEPISAAAWEPSRTTQSYTITIPINWATRSVRAQFRDAAGHLSPIFCDDIYTEGFPL